MIPETVEWKLGDALWIRPGDDRLHDAFSRLGIVESDDIAVFYRRYWGPFRSDFIGHELLDMIEQDENILSSTEIVRQEFGFPKHFTVVSTLNGTSVLVYDVTTKCVFDVDFEGGEQLLKEGRLSARWRSWNEFIMEYFR